MSKTEREKAKQEVTLLSSLKHPNIVACKGSFMDGDNLYIVMEYVDGGDLNDKILQPTLNGFIEDGLDFHGVLFVGLMIGSDGPKVIEFNNRFGDPETQSVLMRLETDLADIFDACIDGTLDKIDIKWSDKRSVCVVIASGGYPGSYEKGKIISGLDDVDDDIVVFHAGTSLNENGDVVTAGGRVLGVTATGATNDEARAKAFANVEKITFEGSQFRRDIGKINQLES